MDDCRFSWNHWGWVDKKPFNPRPMNTTVMKWVAKLGGALGQTVPQCWPGQGYSLHRKKVYTWNLSKYSKARGVPCILNTHPFQVYTFPWWRLYNPKHSGHRAVSSWVQPWVWANPAPNHGLYPLNSDFTVHIETMIRFLKQAQQG